MLWRRRRARSVLAVPGLDPGIDPAIHAFRRMGGRRDHKPLLLRPLPLSGAAGAVSGGGAAWMAGSIPGSSPGTARTAEAPRRVRRQPTHSYRYKSKNAGSYSDSCWSASCSCPLSACRHGRPRDLIRSLSRLSTRRRKDEADIAATSSKGSQEKGPPAVSLPSGHSLRRSAWMAGTIPGSSPGTAMALLLPPRVPLPTNLPSEVEVWL